MKKGFLATLFAAAIPFAGIQTAFANAPVISGLPDVQVGDMENNPVGTDNNYFVFANAFQFSSRGTDADSTQAQLVWTFEEFDYLSTGVARPATFAPGQPRAMHYQINGKAPAAAGDALIAADKTAGFPAARNAANKINSGVVGNAGDFASFRDIVFSPGAGTGPFPDPPVGEAAKAAEGKSVAFFVSDEAGNLASKTVIVKTVDDAFDSASTSNLPTQVVDDKITTQGAWELSGITVPEASESAPAGELKITLTAAGSGRYRIFGWKNSSLLNYNAVGSSNYVRGKFYVYASGQAANAPINNVPNFRMRLMNLNDVIAVNEVLHGNTGNVFGANDATKETNAGVDIQPSRDSTKPSLYRVDLDPIDVPAAAGKAIVPLIEILSFETPAIGSISLAELQLATYPALADVDGTLKFKYIAGDATFGAAGSAIAIAGFNYINDFTPGRAWDTFFSGEPLAQQSALSVSDANGVTVDSSNTGTARFGQGIADIHAKTAATEVRIVEDKLYRARYHATSDMAVVGAGSTPGQGFVRFRLGTAQFTMTSRLELNGPANPTNATVDPVLRQVLPGVGCLNPDFDPTIVTNPAVRDGGWYTVLMNSPLSADIRADKAALGSTAALRMPTLSAQPGPGSSSTSARDIIPGIDVLRLPEWVTFVDGPSGANSGTHATSTSGWPIGPNIARMRLERMFIYEYPQLDDGGYLFP